MLSKAEPMDQREMDRERYKQDLLQELTWAIM